MSLCPRDVGTDFGFHHSARDSPNRENTNTILALYLIAYITIIALGLFEVPLCRYNWRFFFIISGNTFYRFQNWHVIIEQCNIYRFIDLLMGVKSLVRS